MKGLEAWPKDGRRPMILGPEELVQALRERHQGRSWRYSRKAAVKLVQDQYDLRRHAPRPETREEDYDVGSPREFAERLAWMTVNGKPDIEQWENHIRHRDVALTRLAAPKPEGQECATCNNLGNGCYADVMVKQQVMREGCKEWMPLSAAPAPGTKGEA